MLANTHSSIGSIFHIYSAVGTVLAKQTKFYKCSRALRAGFCGQSDVDGRFVVFIYFKRI